MKANGSTVARIPLIYFHFTFLNMPFSLTIQEIQGSPHVNQMKEEIDMDVTPSSQAQVRPLALILSFFSRQQNVELVPACLMSC